MQDTGQTEVRPTAPTPAPGHQAAAPRPSAASVVDKLKGWPLSELRELRAALDGLIQRRTEAARTEALAQIQALAADAGLSSEEVAGLLAPKPKRGRRGVLRPGIAIRSRARPGRAAGRCPPGCGSAWSGTGQRRRTS